jgi:hypothetical protein
MEKRYQVFVSSTYDDLIEERQEVMHALLELDCIPSGMELFPAADDDQWSIIQQVIDDCDYYLVIIAGRYGSRGQSGKSYTQMEYEYAVSKAKPIIAFLHKSPQLIPAIRTEATDLGKAALAEFRFLVEQKLCKHWSSASELGSVVSRSLIKLIKMKPDVGWVRADLVPDETASREILRLKKRVEELEQTIEHMRSEPPKGTETLLQGDDAIDLWYDCKLDTNVSSELDYYATFRTTWNDIFAVMAPLMIDKASEIELKRALDDWIYHNVIDNLYKENQDATHFYNISLYREGFNTVKVQMRALGLIRKSDRPKGIKDSATYWTLTPYGDDLMTKLVALKAIQNEELLMQNGA